MATYKQMYERVKEDLEKLKKGELTSSPARISDHHEAGDILYSLEYILGEQEEDDEFSIDDLDDVIMEEADGSTPVYNADRAEWFGKNWTAYDDIAEELGKESMGDDIMQGIGTAYCLTYKRALREVLKAYAEELEANE